LIPLQKKTQPGDVKDHKKLPGSLIARSYTFLSMPASEWLILLVLSLVALIPRIVLARRLDLVTDEVVYIMGGKVYLPLLFHLNITSDLWKFNYEHPPVAKILIGLCLYLNAHLGYLLNVLFVARIPSIVLGTVLVGAIYRLGWAPFGRVIALLAALCLAVSPWLVYFSALAYLDMTMTAFVTLAYLVLWPALRQPRLYLLSGALLGVAVASKYTAALVVPGMILFIAYYYLAIYPRIPADERKPVPWQWLLGALVLVPVTFFIVDPAIWRDPWNLFINSLLFEWHHSINGHLTFIAGRYSGHVPHWTVLFILITKLSIFVPLPALFFGIFAVIQLARYHLHRSCLPLHDVAGIAFLFIWLGSMLSMFSLLNIVVGTHYLLPLTPPIALAGAFGLATILRYHKMTQFRTKVVNEPAKVDEAAAAKTTLVARPQVNSRAIALLVALLLLFVGPHLLGLVTVYAAEGYTSEVFHGENTALQVAYPAYREAGLWLMAHTHTSSYVGLVALPNTLAPAGMSVSWYQYNQNIIGRLKFKAVVPSAVSFPYDYLIWPMHLVQRGYAIPAAWLKHIVHIIMGGDTTYCFILARNPATIS
jgi:4-amino-4-deoxy-L-arabinose transferase-like glycosyltransferase